MKQSKKSTVLCYVRPWNVSQFKFIAQQIASESVVVGCSEHPQVDESGIARDYKCNIKESVKKKDLNVKGLDEKKLNDVILRCRLLRKLSDHEARRHIWSMGSAIEKSLDRYSPSFVLSLTIDSYVMDLLRLLSEARNIRFIGFIGTFVNGYYRISARGESNLNSAADLSLVPVLRKALLKEDYTPVFNAKSISNPRRSVYRRWAANIARVPYFWCKRIISGDYYNCHYWTSQLIAAEQLHFLPPGDPGDDSWLKRVRGTQLPTLYIPLQMFPECTVDYWCQDIEVIDYYKILDALIERLSDSFSIVVKEHPSVMGSRPSGFYSALSKDSRVIVVPTYVPSNEVLKAIDGVIVWTGSVGFESMLRGKPVFGLARPFYVSGARFLQINGIPDVEAMSAHIKYCKENPVTLAEQDAMLEFLAKQIFVGDFINDGTWSKDNDIHVSQARTVATSYVMGSDYL